MKKNRGRPKKGSSETHGVIAPERFKKQKKGHERRTREKKGDVSEL